MYSDLEHFRANTRLISPAYFDPQIVVLVLVELAQNVTFKRLAFMYGLKQSVIFNL